MLTVKVISLSGREQIFQGHHVEFRPKTYYDLDEPVEILACERNRVIVFTEDHSIITEIHMGTIFVMNQNGKTVSRYDLGASMVEKGANPQDTVRNISESTFSEMRKAC